jgi:hypothetical protein
MYRQLLLFIIILNSISLTAQNFLLDKYEVDNHAENPHLDAKKEQVRKLKIKEEKRIYSKYESGMKGNEQLYMKIKYNRKGVVTSTVNYSLHNTIVDSVAYVYDKKGNIARIFQKANTGISRTEYKYNSNNKRIEERFIKNKDDKTTIKKEYDKNGDIEKITVNITGELPSETTYTHKTVKDSAKNTTIETWGINNRVDENSKTSITLDSNGNKVKEISFYAKSKATVIMQYAYDSNNNLIEKTNGLENEDPEIAIQVTRYKYDEKNRLVERVEQSKEKKAGRITIRRTIKTTYHANGNILERNEYGGEDRLLISYKYEYVFY